MQEKKVTVIGKNGKPKERNDYILSQQKKQSEKLDADIAEKQTQR